VMDSIVTSVSLLAWNICAPTGLIFMKFDIQLFSENAVRKFQVSLKSDESNMYLT
jgi:hypothetical protein